jgi:hypothetical protein
MRVGAAVVAWVSVSKCMLYRADAGCAAAGSTIDTIMCPHIHTRMYYALPRTRVTSISISHGGGGGGGGGSSSKQQQQAAAHGGVLQWSCPPRVHVYAVISGVNLTMKDEQ